MENHLQRYLEFNETVDHIDCDFGNNNLSNLRILDRSEHSRQDTKRLVSTSFTCVMCEKHFQISGKRLSQCLSNYDRGSAGPFCSKSCAGKYGAFIQKGYMDPVPSINYDREYTKLKFEHLGGDTKVEPDEIGETLTYNDDGNPEPSPKEGEGVETT